jgi:hypothetical protein
MCEASEDRIQELFQDFSRQTSGRNYFLSQWGCKHNIKAVLKTYNNECTGFNWRREVSNRETFCKWNWNFEEFLDQFPLMAVIIISMGKCIWKLILWVFHTAPSSKVPYSIHFQYLALLTPLNITHAKHSTRGPSTKIRLAWTKRIF